MIAERTLEATLLEGAGHTLHPSGGSMTMSEGWAPHVQGRLTIPIPDEDVQELIDSRVARRVELEAGAAFHALTPAPAQARTFNLGLRGRRIGHTPGTIELELASDEALLMDDVLLAGAANRDARAYQSSLRALIDNVVLSRIGAHLEPGTADTPFYVLSTMTNPIVNPSLEAGIGSWGAGSGASALQAFSGTALVGTACARWTAAAGTSEAFPAASITSYAATPGKEYTFSVYLHSSIARTAGVVLRFYAANGSTLLGQTAGATVVTATNAWKRLSVTAIAPAGTAYVFPYITTAGNTAGQFHFADAAQLEQGPLTPYFDGTGPYNEPAAAEYTFAWAGTPHASASIRTALGDRSPELLDWQPGVSAWDFIQPLFQAAGLRLFCDERRRWYLVDTSYLAAGQTQLAVGVNATDAYDTMSRSRSEWCDAALVTYRWVDANGLQQVRYDWYAEPGHTMARTVELARAYPGPGYAEYIVKRAAGKGRQIEVDAAAQYTAQPSQPVRISLPDTPIQTGVISSVEWNLDDATMRVESRGLTDTPLNAIALLPGTVDSLVGTVDAL